MAEVGVGWEGVVPQGQPRAVATAPRVRPGRGGRARPRSRARTATVAAARRPGSSRRPHAPQSSLLALVRAGASSWTAAAAAAAAARGAGGQQRDGTPARDQGKEVTSCGRGRLGPPAPRERGGGHCGATSGQVRAGGVAFRAGVNGSKEVVGTKGRQR